MKKRSLEWDGRLLHLELDLLNLTNLISCVGSRDGFFFFPTRSCASIERKKKVETLPSIFKDAIRVGPDRQDERSLSLNLPCLPLQGVAPPTPPILCAFDRASITPQHGKHHEQRNKQHNKLAGKKAGKKQCHLLSTILFSDKNEAIIE